MIGLSPRKQTWRPHGRLSIDVLYNILRIDQCARGGGLGHESKCSRQSVDKTAVVIENVKHADSDAQ